MRKLVIDGIEISDNSDCFVIAEIGHNHQGSVQKAKDLFKAAAECGVNAVKLQKRNNKGLFTRAMYASPYDNENSFGATYGQHREALEFGREEYLELKQTAQDLGLIFFATAFDFDSIDFLEQVGVPAYKIASGDLKNTPLQKAIARTGKPIIMSTGGGTMEDVQRAYDAIMPINPQLCILQCTGGYPVEPEDMNLRVISSYRSCFPDIVVGLSDHQNGIAMAVVAYTLGARVIEKHFTLNRAWKGTDHAFSLEPVGMRKMVRDLKRARQAMGSDIKQPMPCELRPIMKMSKKIVAARDLPAGHCLSEADLAFKSPGDGLSPSALEQVLGKPLRRALQEEEPLSLDDLAQG